MIAPAALKPYIGRRSGTRRVDGTSRGDAVSSNLYNCITAHAMDAGEHVYRAPSISFHEAVR